MRTVDVLLRVFRSWSGVMNRACAQYMVYHEDHLLFYVRDPRFAYHTHPGPVFVKSYIHFCGIVSPSEIRVINEFLKGIGCVNKFKVTGNGMDIVGERKIEPKYPISWISKLQ